MYWLTSSIGKQKLDEIHMAHIGAPVLGDGKYGNVAANKRMNVFRQALCAYSVRFELDESSPLAYLKNITPEAPQPEFEKRFFSNQLG